METEKSYHLQAGDQVRPVIFQRSQSQTADGIDSSLGLKAWDWECWGWEKIMSQLNSQAEREFNFPLPFALQALYRLEEAYSHWEGNPLHLVYWFKCYSHLETPPTDMPRILSNWTSGHPLAQSDWHVKLTPNTLGYAVLQVFFHVLTPHTTLWSRWYYCSVLQKRVWV